MNEHVADIFYIVNSMF